MISVNWSSSLFLEEITNIGVFFLKYNPCQTQLCRIFYLFSRKYRIMPLISNSFSFLDSTNQLTFFLLKINISNRYHTEFSQLVLFITILYRKSEIVKEGKNGNVMEDKIAKSMCRLAPLDFFKNLEKLKHIGFRLDHNRWFNWFYQYVCKVKCKAAEKRDVWFEYDVSYCGR